MASEHWPTRYLRELFHRHPNLQMVSVESGIGWVPFMLETMDRELPKSAPPQAAELNLDFTHPTILWPKPLKHVPEAIGHAAARVPPQDLRRERE